MSFERRELYARTATANGDNLLTCQVVRFLPKGSSTVLIGQPVDSDVDVGAAVRKGQEVKVKVFSGSSVVSPGSATDKVEVIDRILSPLSQQEAGTIRCIGLNYRAHAEEAGMAVPDMPVVFLCATSPPPCAPLSLGANTISVSRKPPWPTLGRRQL